MSALRHKELPLSLSTPASAGIVRFMPVVYFTDGTIAAETKTGESSRRPPRTPRMFAGQGRVAGRLDGSIRGRCRPDSAIPSGELAGGKGRSDPRSLDFGTLADGSAPAGFPGRGADIGNREAQPSGCASSLQNLTPLRPLPLPMPSMNWQFAWEHDHFREVLAPWLPSLPMEGWTGTIFQLQIALNNAAHRRNATRYSPRPSRNA